MERAEVKTEWAKQETPSLADMSPQQINDLLEYRSELFAEVAQKYKELVEAIYRLPIHVVYRQHAFMNIDQGWHWVKDALDNVWELPEKKTAESIRQLEPSTTSEEKLPETPGSSHVYDTLIT